jgi:hypothetical protein
MVQSYIESFSVLSKKTAHSNCRKLSGGLTQEFFVSSTANLISSPELHIALRNLVIQRYLDVGKNWLIKPEVKELS